MGLVAHSMVAADAERAQELARLYRALYRAAAADGSRSEAARDAHRRMIARIDEWEPLARPDAHDRDGGFHATFVRGLRRCAVRRPGELDLGLGESSAIAALLGVSGGDLGELYSRWVESPAPSHPFARYPWVPRGRFCASTQLVAGSLPSTGPVGWVAGDDVVSVARDLLALAREQLAFAPELEAMARRVESAARRGDAVIGFIEYRRAAGRARSRLADATVRAVAQRSFTSCA